MGENTDPDLLKRFRSGDVRALARAISLIERRDESVRELEQALRPDAKTPGVAGFTGAPGTGKSTLVDAVVSLLRKKQSSVAVLATDPNSPFSGGAILGDRIRMQRHALDPKVFIRSMGARGHLGGLSLASREAIRLLGAFGFDEVILETADIFVVNKADLDGYTRVMAELRAMLSLAPKAKWKPPILATVASRQEGVEQLWEAVLAHRRHLEKSGQAQALSEQRLRDETGEVAAELARRRAREALEDDPELARRLLDDRTPYRTAEEILDRK